MIALVTEYGGGVLPPLHWAQDMGKKLKVTDQPENFCMRKCPALVWEIELVSSQFFLAHTLILVSELKTHSSDYLGILCH